MTGRVRSMELQMGRRGSEYFVLVLEEESAAPSGTTPPVQVLSAAVPKVRRGDHALVQGIYHREGKQAGRPFEHFVNAEVILRN